MRAKLNILTLAFIAGFCGIGFYSLTRSPAETAYNACMYALEENKMEVCYQTEESTGYEFLCQNGVCWVEHSYTK